MATLSDALEIAKIGDILYRDGFAGECKHVYMVFESRERGKSLQPIFDGERLSLSDLQASDWRIK